MNVTAQQHLRAMAPAANVAAVTPDDDADLPGGVCDSLYVTAAGDLEFIAKEGGDSDLFAVTAGQLIPVQVARVLETTTATVLALY